MATATLEKTVLAVRKSPVQEGNLSIVIIPEVSLSPTTASLVMVSAIGSMDERNFPGHIELIPPVIDGFDEASLAVDETRQLWVPFDVERKERVPETGPRMLWTFNPEDVVVGIRKCVLGRLSEDTQQRVRLHDRRQQEGYNPLYSTVRQGELPTMTISRLAIVRSMPDGGKRIEDARALFEPDFTAVNE